MVRSALFLEKIIERTLPLNFLRKNENYSLIFLQTKNLKKDEEEIGRTAARKVKICMSKSEQSKEKGLVVQGIIIGDPIQSVYGVGDSGLARYDSKLLLELKHDVSATFKRSEPVHLKAGEIVLVKCREDTYTRKGDHITLVEASMFKLRHEVASLGDKTIPDSIYIISSKLYNETLDFSFYF
jgi:hypothetical protein